MNDLSITYKGWHIQGYENHYYIFRRINDDAPNEYLFYDPTHKLIRRLVRASVMEDIDWKSEYYAQTKYEAMSWIDKFLETCKPEFTKLIEIEASDAITKHGQFKSLHEGYAVILEEVDELWDEIKKKEEKRNYINMQKELVQIASMCLKLHDLVDIKLEEKKNIAAHERGESQSLPDLIARLKDDYNRG